jgi:hypothetical protein
MTTVTAQDLQDWSPRLDARAHLPTLIRRLIFASVRPDQIVVPDAEGTGHPGLDGIVFSATGAPPYVPAGRSAWEFKTSGNPQTELGKDYRKRTNQIAAAERATTTIVLVTTRIWDRTSVDKWIARRVKDGWVNIKVITAEDLATWLSQCPGALGWLEEHCGRNPYGRTALRDWWDNWSTATEPAVPPALLLAGRQSARDELLAGLSGAVSSRAITAVTEDEAIAFLAATLLVARPLKPADEGPEPTDAEIAAHDAAETSWREAILERTIVVHDTNAWRSLAAHHEPLILVPVAPCDPTIDAAVASGHHVILPQVARPGESILPRIARPEARQAWEQAGVPWNDADELARSARRSLTSLRRRRGRAGHLRRPPWATGTTSRLLAPLLLAGSWDSTLVGDEQIVLELADRQSLRSLDGDLAVVAAEPDPPIRRHKTGWQFVDPIDAWDQLGPVISQHDLDLFQQRAVAVLTYRNPTLDMTTAERLAAELHNELPPPEYSQAIRQGFAETIAILGAIREDAQLPGGGTGATAAARIVHAVLGSAPSTRWNDVVDLLPDLAEAAPSTFLNAVEDSLRKTDPPILTLFNERADDFGLSHRSAHTHLLWALERLAFSPAHLSRVAVTFGQLAERDPGGTLQNRPENSLRDMLHVIHPQSAVDATARLAAIDALRTAAPQAAWTLMLGLITALDRGMILNRGPRHRDWPRAELPTRPEVLQAVTAIGGRIVYDLGDDGGRWIDATRLLTRLPGPIRTSMLTQAGVVWDQLPDDAQRTVTAELTAQVARHTKYRDTAWALDDQGLAELKVFVDAHASEPNAPGSHMLFSFWPAIEGHDLDTAEGQDALRMLREDAVRAALPDAIPELAAASELPGQIGATLATITTDLDDEILGWIPGDESHLRAVGFGLARARFQDDPDWLYRTVETHPELKVDLLLAGDLSRALINYVDTTSEDDQAAFWSKVNPWTVTDDMRLTVAQQLCSRDRPFSAMNLLLRDNTDTFPIELGLDVMSKPLTGTNESIEHLHSPAYALQQMLDRLDAAGAPTEQLAMLEWWYHPALRHQRTPAAFNTLLAKDPVLFARLVALTTYSDEDLDDLNRGDAEVGSPDDIDAVADGAIKDDENSTGKDTKHDVGEDESVDGTWRFADTPENRDNAFDMLRNWSPPLPGSIGDIPPEVEALQSWIDRAQAELTALKRIRAGSSQIGHALSGPVYDPDGTWPCRAVRDALERANDPDVESGLWAGRMNSRGVVSRDPYSGGEQERQLAATYKSWADQVRGTWPRAGAVLDSIVQSHEAEARRQDGSADDLGDR